MTGLAFLDCVPRVVPEASRETRYYLQSEVAQTQDAGSTPYMIETKAIDQSGVAIHCPHCHRTLLALFSNGPKNAFDRHLYSDRSIPIAGTPRPSALRWDIEVRLGACHFCARAYFGITARFIDAIQDDDGIDVYFFRNGDRGEENNFLGRRSEESWIISRVETRLGPMLEHQFGPFAATLGRRARRKGATGCITGGPSELARHFLLTQWDELRAMPKTLGLGTTGIDTLTR
jgi:hypothetical protein